jgi:hypothetical protein
MCRIKRHVGRAVAKVSGISKHDELLDVFRFTL